MRHTHSRSTLKHVTGIYIAARKLNWGGLIPFYMSGQLSAFADKTQRRIQKPRFVDNDDEDDEDDDEDFKQPRRRGAGRGVMAAEDEGWAVESPRMRGTGNTTFFEADHEEVEKLHKRGGGGRKSKSVTAEHRQRDVSAAQEEGASEQRIGRRRRAVPPRRRPSEDGGAGDE